MLDADRAMARREPFRVILWAPGYTGQHVLREMLRRIMHDNTAALLGVGASAA